MSRPHLLNNSLALSSSLRTKSCNRSYSTTLGLVFKLGWIYFYSQYGTKGRRATVACCYSNPGPSGVWPRSVLLQSIPLRTRRPRRVPDQPKYHQDLLSWPRPIRLVLTVPCTTSVRPVPTVPAPRPCVQCRRICAHTRPPTCRWHLRPRARDHARALMSVCGVKPRESALIPL